MFLVFLTIPGNESLLKKELSLRYPELKLSFSTKGLVSFKLPSVAYPVSGPFFYSLLYGPFLGKYKAETAPAHFETLSPEIPLSYKYDVSSRQVEILLNNHEIWKIKTDYNFFEKLKLPVEVEKGSEFPSRSYLKTKQILQSLGIEKDFNNHQILDIGSSPGGNAAYLLNKNNCVTAIDPAEMDRSLIGDHFTHIKRPVQEVAPRELEKKIDWIMNDMNLSLEFSLKQTQKFIIEYKNNIKGAIITMKTPLDSDVGLLLKAYESMIEKFSYLQIIPMQAPAHRKESSLVVLNKRFFQK